MRLIVPARVELEVPQELSVGGDDPDMATRDRQNDAGALECAAHPDVIELALVADRDDAVAIDPVVTDMQLSGRHSASGDLQGKSRVLLRVRGKESVGLRELVVLSHEGRIGSGGKASGVEC